MEFGFRDVETNELLATMPEGTLEEARKEAVRIEDEYNCVVRVVKEKHK